MKFSLYFTKIIGPQGLEIKNKIQLFTTGHLRITDGWETQRKTSLSFTQCIRGGFLSFGVTDIWGLYCGGAASSTAKCLASLASMSHCIYHKCASLSYHLNKTL